MELIFPCKLHHVLVAADAACLQSLAGQLLVLVRDQVNTSGEHIHRHLLGTQVKDSDLCVWRLSGWASPPQPV